MWLKIIIVLLFLAVLFCLGRGLFFLLKGEGSSAKLVNSLTARVGLTALIMLIIVVAWLFGDIHSNAPWLYR
ncbi:MAG: twin transmembrane helix small protein [Endozoicomonas sp.]|uniref:twin transmembrane helix small protein n=1 Tax=Endozoicomonas sp. TaxID=1892382 RepID=UPI003D9B5A64